MRRAAPRVGEEFGIGIDVPQLPLRLDRPQRVEDAQPQAQWPGESDRRLQLVGGLALQAAFGFPVHRLAG